MIVVTHEMQFAREAADRVYFIQEGSFIEAGPPEQVLDAPRDERTQAFLARFLSAPSPAATVVWRAVGVRTPLIAGAAATMRSARLGLLVDLEDGPGQAGQSDRGDDETGRAVGPELASRGPIAMRAMRRMT